MSCVVFCEDEPQIRKLILLAMRGTGHEVHMANDGIEGLALLEKVRPNLLVTDISMPRMDGYELADAVRSRAHLAQIPIVFLTASLQREQREEALRHGALAILAKPFNVAEMRVKVDGLLERLFVGDESSARKTEIVSEPPGVPHVDAALAPTQCPRAHSAGFLALGVVGPRADT